MSPTSAPAQAASDLGRERVLDPRALSVGRDFEVFHATLRGRAVIVKVARQGAEAREPQLEAEAAALHRLAATNAAPALIGLTRLPGGRLALVRGFVEGVSLAALIERALVRRRWQGARRWTAPTRAIVAAVLDAVERVHDAGLVHNDLKPDDILIRMRSANEGGGFDAVLIDVGLAAKPKRGGPGGTVAYAAPERLEGEPGTVKSDVWALGAILFELCAGTRAYPADQPVDARLERRFAIDKSPREAVALAWRHLAAEVRVAVAGALDADVAARTKSVGALRKALALDARAVPSWRATDLGTDVTRGALSDPRTAKERRRTGTSAALIAAVIGTVLALALAFGPVARGLGLGGSTKADNPAACDAVRARAERLCRGLSGEQACRAALTALGGGDDCAARADLLGACGVP